MNMKAAIILCRTLEPLFQKFGYHVGLTGGCLYKEGERKDVDIIVYPHHTTNAKSAADLVKNIEASYPALGYWKEGSGLKGGHDSKQVHKFLMGMAPDVVVVDLFFLT